MSDSSLPHGTGSRPVGRLLRLQGPEDGRSSTPDGHRPAATWVPVGEPLPPFDHAPPRPAEPIATWVLPGDLGARAGDVVVVGEIAHRLLAPCPADDAAREELVRQTLALHEPDAARAWLASVELWVGLRLDPDWVRTAAVPTLSTG